MCGDFTKLVNVVIVCHRSRLYMIAIETFDMMALRSYAHLRWYFDALHDPNFIGPISYLQRITFTRDGGHHLIGLLLTYIDMKALACIMAP